MIRDLIRRYGWKVAAILACSEIGFFLVFRLPMPTVRLVYFCVECCVLLGIAWWVLRKGDKKFAAFLALFALLSLPLAWQAYAEMRVESLSSKPMQHL